ncbi:hypothetical protein HK101_007497 [Irineochytrium annulatum]|nr:hypothetical protein HK101_007497 [Irineochytrium annulatum]
MSRSFSPPAVNTARGTPTSARTPVTSSSVSGKPPTARSTPAQQAAARAANTRSPSLSRGVTSPSNAAGAPSSVASPSKRGTPTTKSKVKSPMGSAGTLSGSMSGNSPTASPLASETVPDLDDRADTDAVGAMSQEELRAADGERGATPIDEPHRNVVSPDATSPSLALRPESMASVRSDGATGTAGSPAAGNIAGQEIRADAEDVVAKLSSPEAATAAVPSSVDGNAAVNQEMVKEMEDLKMRLRIFEAKRADDLDKTKELERIKAEVEAASVAKSAFSVKLSELQAELRESRRLLKDALAEKESLELQVLEANEALEMMTLDKEVAEERAEVLQGESEQLREKIEEITIELEVMKEEAGEGGVGGESSSVDAKNLERQNERLKEALLRLRDASSATETELKDTITDLKSELTRLQEEKGHRDRLEDQLFKAEVQIEELKESLDSVLGSEHMVEHLTEKNLELGEKLEEMKLTIEDLEALKELNDELEENHVLAEQDLQTEIDLKDRAIIDLKGKLSHYEDTLADNERTLKQFRELVRSLQKFDIQSLKETTKDGRTETLSSQSQEMLNLNLQLQSTVMKTKSKSIEIELRNLEVSQAQEHVEILKLYLPKTFYRDEYDPILCVLLFRRLVFKCNLMKGFLEDSLRVMKDELSGPQMIVDVQKCVTQLEHVVEQYTGLQKASPLALQQLALANAENLCVNADRMEVELNRLDTAFEPAQGEFDVEVRAKLEIARAEFLEPLPNMKAQIQGFKTLARKLLRKTIEVTEQGNAYTEASVQTLADANKSAAKVVDYCSILSGHVSTHIKDRVDKRLPLSVAVLVQLSSNASEALLAFTETAMGTGLTSSLERLTEATTRVFDKSDDFGEKVTVDKSAWLARSEVVKAEFSINTDMQKQIEGLNEEILALMKDIRQKEQSHQEATVKIDLLERKAEMLKKHTETIAAYEEELAALRVTEKSYKEAIEHLHAENLNIEQENAKFKKLISRQERQGFQFTTPKPVRLICRSGEDS